MKPAITKFAKPPKPRVFQTAARKPAAALATAAPGSKPKKRDNIFSKSRDTREDRSARQMKTSSNPQTFPHGH